MNAFLVDVADLIIGVAFGIYMFAVLLRLLLQLARADFYNPLAQFIVTFTNPALRPLRRVIPGLFGVDLASIVLLLLLQSTELWLRSLLSAPMPPLTLLVLAVFKLLHAVIDLYLIAILIRVVLSWISPYGVHDNPIGNMVVKLTEPLLRPVRRRLPPVSGFDFSVLVVSVLLLIVRLALVHVMGPASALL